MSIDWKSVAASNNMTPEEFTHDIFTAVMAIGINRIEKEDADEMTVTAGGYRLTIRKHVKANEELK